jgi:hypothetical protein
MTYKVIALEFVVPTALAIVLSIGAVRLKITTLARSIRRKPTTPPPEGTDLLNFGLLGSMGASRAKCKASPNPEARIVGALKEQQP